ncbi:hypothetical protein ACF0H5_010561 [Mactra antiquata]
MKFIINTAKTLRNHWKKSIFFTCVGAYAVKYGYGRYEDDMLRRKYCAEAKVYGEKIAEFAGKNRKITVFLNPVASTTEGRKLFEKNAAPILYLAGLEVNVVKTEYEGQIKEFFKVLEAKHTDGVVVAGGNGSVVEMITGMMRKEDKEFRQKTPIGIIPTGKTNKFASFFFGSDKEQVRRMLDAAMAIVKGMTEKVDIMKIQGEDGRTTFALCGLEMGAYRDAKEKTSKYWYMPGLKHRYTYIRSTLTKWPAYINGQLEYMEAKETDVLKKKEKKIEEPKVQKSQSWTQSLLFFLFKPRAPPARTVEEEEDEEEYENEEFVKRDINNIELTISSNFDQSNMPMQGLQLGIGPENISRSDFITEGWNRLKVPTWKYDHDCNESILCRKIKFTPEIKEDTESWYSIDGEHFEAMPIEITLLKNRLKIFSPVDSAPS